MSAKDFILAAGAVAGAATSVLGLLALLTLPLRKFIRTHKEADAAKALDIKALKETQELQAGYLRENYTELLRHTMYATNFPIEEKVNAGEKYIAAGGNGSAKVKHEDNMRLLRKKREEAAP